MWSRLGGTSHDDGVAPDWAEIVSAAAVGVPQEAVAVGWDSKLHRDDANEAIG